MTDLSPLGLRTIEFTAATRCELPVLLGQLGLSRARMEDALSHASAMLDVVAPDTPPHRKIKVYVNLDGYIVKWEDAEEPSHVKL